MNTRQRTPWILLALASLLVLAGCIGAQDDEIDPASFDAPDEQAQVLPWVLDDDPTHDHQDPSQHQASWNMNLVGHHFLTHDPLEHPAWTNQLVVNDGYVFISAYEIPPSDQPGLIVLNATNPEEPKIASTFIYEDLVPIDIFPSADGDYVFLSGHWWYPNGDDYRPNLIGCTPDTPLPKWDRFCDPQLPHGFYAVNVADPENPHFAGEFNSFPSGHHTIKHGVIEDGPHAGEYLFGASYGFAYGDRQASAVDIIKIEEGQERLEIGDDASVKGTDELVFVEHGRYVLDPEPLDGRTFVHDTWFDYHPETGDPILFVAGWDAGVHIVDISNPAQPEKLAVWNDFDHHEYGNVHSVYTPEEGMIDDVWPILVSPEYAQKPHSGKIWTVDVTDPENPETLGEFILPGDPGHEEVFDYLYSPHNLLIEDGIAYHGHNHAGAWALDVSTKENLTDPKPIGMYMTVPEDQDVAHQMSHVRSMPSLWNVWVEDGLAYASDRYTGVYILELDERDPGEPPWSAWDLD